MAGRDADGMGGAAGFPPVSFAPPLALVSFAAAACMAGWLQRSDRFSVNLLTAGDAGRALRFARPGRPDGWEGLGETEAVRVEGGAPAQVGALARLDCAPRGALDLGDHVGLVGRVERIVRRTDAEQLVYYRGRFRELGAVLAPAPWPAAGGDEWAMSW